MIGQQFRMGITERAEQAHRLFRPVNGFDSVPEFGVLHGRKPQQIGLVLSITDPPGNVQSAGVVRQSSIRPAAFGPGQAKVVQRNLFGVRINGSRGGGKFLFKHIQAASRLAVGYKGQPKIAERVDLKRQLPDFSGNKERLFE